MAGVPQTCLKYSLFSRNSVMLITHQFIYLEMLILVFLLVSVGDCKKKDILVSFAFKVDLKHVPTHFPTT